MSPIRTPLTPARHIPPGAWILLAAGLLLLLRVVVASTLRVNSDEPQHLHIVWCWTQGLLPYRDVFDNHAPLFHILYAPLIWILGERADIVAWARLAVIPWYAITLGFTFLLGRALYDRRVGLVGMAIVALQPTFFLRSVEFRPDDAWAAAWLATVTVAVMGKPTPQRAFQCGLLGGLAAAFSIKSAILITAAILAAAMVLFWLALQRRAPKFITTMRAAINTAFGGAILPVTILIVFVAVGSWPAIRYCLVEHNMATGLGRWTHIGWRAWIFPVAAGSLGAVIPHALRRTPDIALGGQRLWLLGSAVLYLALRASYQPLLDKQDLLPLVPMLGPFAAVALMRCGEWLGRRSLSYAAVAAVLAVEMAMVLGFARPWRNEAAHYAQQLRDLLALSQPGDYVMDDKAESIFRQRPLYWVLENVTLYHLAHGLIPDDIVQRLVADHVAVGTFERESGEDLEFVRRNYVGVAPHVAVVGQWFGAVPTRGSIDFDIALPRRYAMVSRSGDVDGTLDGTPYTAPRELTPGHHRFTAAHGDDWALEWARAATLGYSPFLSARTSKM